MKINPATVGYGFPTFKDFIKIFSYKILGFSCSYLDIWEDHKIVFSLELDISV